MATTDGAPVEGMVPEWFSESALGLGAVLAASLALAVGTFAVTRGVAALIGPETPGPVFETVAGIVATVALVAAMYVVVGVGTTYLYLTRRGFERGFVLEVPDAAGRRWLGGLVGLAATLVWGGTLVESLAGAAGPGVVLQVPPVLVGAPSALPMGTRGVQFLPVAVLGVVLLAGVVGPAVGALYHGVLQTSLQRVVPVGVAIGATAVVLGLTAMTGGPLGAALVVPFAVATGYAYDRTETLLVPMLAYAALNAFTLTTALVFVLDAMP